MGVATKPMRLWAFWAQVLPRRFHKESPACFMIKAEEGAGYSAHKKLLFYGKKVVPGAHITTLLRNLHRP